MTKKKSRIPVRSLIVAVIVISIAAYFIKICFDGFSREYVEEGWKITSGTILNPDLTLQGRKNIQRKNQGIEQTINYTYTIDGRAYESNSVSRELYVNKEDFPEGKIVDVYCNPADATDTVLIRTKVEKQYLYGIMGTCFIIIFVTLRYLIRDFKNP